MKKFLLMLAVAGCALPAFTVSNARAAEAVAPKVGDALALAAPGSVKWEGWMAESMATCLKGRIFGQSLPDLINPFAVREEDRMWRGEFWGKWFTSTALAYRYQADPALRSLVDQAVKDLLPTQTADGGITTCKPTAEFSNWDTWGRKYTLLGLLAYYELTGDAPTLAAARRHADRVIAHFGPGKANIAQNGNWTGMAASSILEPMVLLYRQTGEARYLDFAHYIVSSWEGPKGPDLVNKALNGVTVFKMFPGPDPKQKGYMSGGASKAYEMMSCYEGLVELHRVTGESKYLEAARKVFADIRDTEITILGSGSSWERWCNGRARQCEVVPEWMETCVTVTWMKFAAQLLRITGDSKYADEIEWSTYNALLAAQKEDGTWWCHYNPLDGQRVAAPEQCSMHMNCCVANGPRGLFLLPALAVMRGAEGPVVNFYERGTMGVALGSGKMVQLKVDSDYPRNDDVEITVQPEETENFCLSLRVPGWSKATQIKVNGQQIANPIPGTYARIARGWKAGDKVQLSFDFSTRLVSDPGGSGRVAVTRGPVVFALDKRVTKPGQGEANILGEKDGTIQAKPVRLAKHEPYQVVLDVPVKSTGKTRMLRFCDYASSGHTWGTNSILRVWLPQPLKLENPFAGIPAVTP